MTSTRRGFTFFRVTAGRGLPACRAKIGGPPGQILPQFPTQGAKCSGGPPEHRLSPPPDSVATPSHRLAARRQRVADARQHTPGPEKSPTAYVTLSWEQCGAPGAPGAGCRRQWGAPGGATSRRRGPGGAPGTAGALGRSQRGTPAGSGSGSPAWRGKTAGLSEFYAP